MTRNVLIGLVGLLVALSFGNSAGAITNDLELVPLFRRGEPIPACHQETGFAISRKSESYEFTTSPSGELNLFLFLSLDTNISQACLDQPLSQGCLSHYSGGGPIADDRIFKFSAEFYPPLTGFIAGFATQNLNPSDPLGGIVYSKATRISFVPCPDTTQIQALSPGNGTPTVSMTARGPISHPFRNAVPVAKWLNPNYDIMGGAGSPAEIEVSLTSYEKNIERVLFLISTADNQTGYVEVPGTATRINRATGVKAYSVRLNAMQLPAGQIEVGAIVVPHVGLPVLKSGAITSEDRRINDNHGIRIFNNRNNQITRRTFHIAHSGSSLNTCGTVGNPCRSMSAALVAFKHQFYPNSNPDVSGLTLQFAPDAPGIGGYTFGTEQPFWPGFSTLYAPLVIRGSLSPLGRKLTTFTGRWDFEQYGYPSTGILGPSKMVIQDVNLQSDPTGPRPRGNIVQLGTASLDSSLVVKNVRFQGLGLDPSLSGSTPCVGQSDGISNIFAKVYGSSFTRFLGNGNQALYANSWVSTSSIAFSNYRGIYNVAAEVDQTGRSMQANGFMFGCNAVTSPHGDIAKNATGRSIARVVNTPNEVDIISQGIYPTSDDNYFIDLDIRVGLVSQLSEQPGRALLVAASNRIILDNVEAVGGPRSTDGSSAVFVVNSFSESSFPSQDSVYNLATFPGPVWHSPMTGNLYSAGAGVNALTPPTN